MNSECPLLVEHQTRTNSSTDSPHCSKNEHLSLSIVLDPSQDFLQQISTENLRPDSPPQISHCSPIVEHQTGTYSSTDSLHRSKSEGLSLSMVLDLPALRQDSPPRIPHYPPLVECLTGTYSSTESQPCTVYSVRFSKNHCQESLSRIASVSLSRESLLQFSILRHLWST